MEPRVTTTIVGLLSVKDHIFQDRRLGGALVVSREEIPRSVE